MDMSRAFPCNNTITYYHLCLYCFTFRHVLASLHFNENVQRQTQQSDDGEDCYKVTFPKFKLGEEVVREVAVPPTYGELGPVCREKG